MLLAIACSRRGQIQPNLAISELMLLDEGVDDLADTKHSLPIFGLEKLRFQLVRQIVLKV
jgi:hypothetical protein